MQINFIGKAKQFVGDSRERKLQKIKNKTCREKCLHRLLILSHTLLFAF